MMGRAFRNAIVRWTRDRHCSNILPKKSFNGNHFSAQMVARSPEAFRLKWFSSICDEREPNRSISQSDLIEKKKTKIRRKKENVRVIYRCRSVIIFDVFGECEELNWIFIAEKCGQEAFKWPWRIAKRPTKITGKKWRSNISSAHVRKFDSATSFRFATNSTFQSAQNIRRLFRLPRKYHQQQQAVVLMKKKNCSFHSAHITSDWAVARTHVVYT